MVFVVGRFPPPVDGQSLATERLASLLEDEINIERVNIEMGDVAARDVPLAKAARAIHFAKLRGRVRSRLAQRTDATILWPAISPDLFGHARDLAVVLPAIRQNQRTFAIVHRGNFRKLFTSALTSTTGRRLADRLSGFVFLTEHLSAECAPWIPQEKRLVIPNTIDDDLVFSDAEVTARRDRVWNRSGLTVLFVGHMIQEKGYLDVLKAISLLRDSGRQVKVHFVGRWSTNEDKTSFFSVVEQKGLTDTVVHHGAIADRSRIRSLHADADVLALPSYYANEAQPLVIIEAMNAGTPVIATAHAGIPEMVRDGVEGLLVPPRDPQAIAHALRRLEKPDLWTQCSTAARTSFTTRFSPNIVRERWVSIVGR